MTASGEGRLEGRGTEGLNKKEKGLMDNSVVIAGMGRNKDNEKKSRLNQNLTMK